MADWEPVEPRGGALKSLVGGVSEQAALDPPMLPSDGWEETTPAVQAGWEPVSDDPMKAVDKGFEMGKKQIDFLNSGEFAHFWQGAKHDQAHKEEMMTGWEKLGKAFEDTGTVKGAVSAANSAGSFLSSAIGMPTSWAAWAFMQNARPMDPDLARYAFESTREWTDLKNVLRHHGVDSTYLDSPNVLDHAMEIVSDTIKPGADKYFGDKESVAKSIYSDVAAGALLAATGKMIPGGKARVFDKPTTVEADNLKAKNPVDDFVGPRDLTKPEDRPLPNTWEPVDQPPEGDIDIKKYDTMENSDRIIDNYRRVNSDYWKNHPRQPLVDAPNEPLPTLRNPGLPDLPSTGFPIIQDHPDQNPFISQLGPDVDTSGKMNNPYIPNVIDQDNAQRGPQHEVGAHSQMDFKTEPQDPILGPNATMSYDEGLRQDIENKRALQGSTEGVRGVEKDYQGIKKLPQEGDVIQFNLSHVPGGYTVTAHVGKTFRVDKYGREHPDGDYQEIRLTYIVDGQTIQTSVTPKNLAQNLISQEGRGLLHQTYGSTDRHMIGKDFHAATDFFNASNLKEALEKVVKYGDKAEDVEVAKRILKMGGDLNEKIDFRPSYDELARGYTGTYPDGSVKVRYHPDHASMSTIVHEAVHVHTNDAVYAYLADRGTPEQMTYGKKLHDLYKIAKKEISVDGEVPDEFKVRFQNLNEFNAYGLTDPHLQRILHSIPTEKGTIWSRFLKNLKEFFGFKSENPTVFTNLVKMMEDWKDIQTTDPQTRYDHTWAVKAARGSNLIDYEKIPADQNYHENAFDALVAAKGKDLHVAIPQNFITPNQVAALSKHPVIGFFMDKMGQITRQAGPRFHQYARDLQPFMFDRATKMDRGSLVKSFKTLVDLQDPALKDARAKAEATNTREALLQQQGLSGREVEFAIKVLDIMKDIHAQDIKSVARLGRVLERQPMYFPRVHGGRFVLKVLDGAGREQYVKGFDSWKDAREKQALLQDQLKGTDYKVQDVKQAMRNDFGDDFSMMLLEHSVPMEFLEKGMKNIEKTRETAPWSFEKARREANVGGYTGEDITNKSEQEALLKVMSWRLQASRNLETKSRMLSEIKYPLFDTALLGEMPRARQVVGNLINRELGVDVSGVKGLDTVLNKAAATVVKSAQAIAHFEKKYIEGKNVGSFKWDDPTVRDDLAKHIVRQITYTTSMFKLSLNIPVYVTNFAGNALIGLDGVRMAHMEGVHPGHAWTALWRSWSYFGQEGGARQFMIDARNEGMIETKGQEHYTTAELPDRNTFDKAIQYPRDKIEEMTNYNAILYYYHFWKAARPDLTGEAFKAKVYQGVKSFTGQYEAYAGPMMFDKAGTSGQMMTNFAKWHFNQLGRLLVDIKALGAERDAIPLLMTVAMTGIGAGLYGLPGVVEYEGLRRLGQSLGAWDMPPVSSLRAKVSEHTLPVWEFFERGVITQASDSLAKFLGANSGPDVSGSMRYSAFFDAPTVAIQTMWQLIGKLIPFGFSELKTLVGGPGATAKEIEEAFKALPSAVTGLAKKGYDGFINPNFFKDKVETADGKVMWRVKDPQHMGQQLYTQSDIEDTYNLLGMKSKREVKNLEGIYYDKWAQRQDQKDIKSYTDGIMAHIGDEALFKNNVKELVKLGGEQAVNSMLTQLKQHITADLFDYFERQWKDLQKQHDVIQRKKEFDRIQATRNMIRP